MSATKTKVGAPQSKRSKHNLSNSHITTTDLFKIQPTFCREVFKGDRFDIKMVQINRVDALPVSSFVEIDNKHHWFFAKMCQIWKPFQAFITKAPYAFPYDGTGSNAFSIKGRNVVPSEVPFITAAELFFFFVLGVEMPDTPSVPFALSASKWFDNPTDAQPTTHMYATGDGTTFDANFYKRIRDGFDNHEYDFVYVGNLKHVDPVTYSTNVGGVACFKLNAIGRYIYSVLYSLGYRVPRFYLGVSWSPEQGGSSTSPLVEQYLGYQNTTELLNIHESFLPWLAYLNIILNYYVPTKFRDYAFVQSMSYLTNPVPHGSSTPIDPSHNTPTDKTWRGLVVNTMLSLYYGSDYFTDTLVKPYSDSSIAPLDDPADPNLGLVASTIHGAAGNPVPAIVQANGTNVTSTLSSYLLASLKAVSTKQQIRALTRNNVVGSMLQQFGIKPESEDMIPYCLSQHNDQIIVSPEVTTADTFDLAQDSDGNPLGSPAGYKAGKGEGTARFDDKFDFDDYGFLICVNSVSPEIMLADGLNREMVHTLPEDFFDPAFVNLGYQPVANFELTLNPDNTDASMPAYKVTDVFGFQNKYAEYGYPKYSMAGDFVINSINRELDGYHFNRKLDGVKPKYLLNGPLFAMAKIAQAGVDNYARFNSQYDRIFDVNDPNYDHIQQWTYFKVFAERSIPANGEFVVGDDDKNVVDGKGVVDNVNA